MISLKRVLLLVLSIVVLAGCGAKEPPKKVIGAPKPAVCAEYKDTVAGVVRKDGGWFVLSAGDKRYVLVPGRCEPESARRKIESSVGRSIIVSGRPDGAKFKVDKIWG